MKTGFRGINSGCHRPSMVWGVSCNAPGNHLVYGDNDQSPGWTIDTNIMNNVDSTGYLQSNIFDDDPYTGFYPVTRLQELNNSGETTSRVNKDVLPLDDDFVPQDGRTWDFYAAKVPAIWPQSPCQGDVAISSKEDGTWSHTLGWVLEHYHYDEDSYTYDRMSTPRYCYGSRAIYVNGQQTWISYCTSDWAMYSPTNPASLKFVSRPYDLIGVHSILPVGINGTGSADTIDTYGYRCTTFGGIEMDYGTATHIGNMIQANWFQHNMQELHMLCVGYLTLANGVGDPPYNNSYNVTISSPVNCRCYGKQFFIMSSYKPGGTVLGTNLWAVSRIEYDSVRWLPYPSDPDVGETDPTSTATIQAFSSPASTVDGPAGDLGTGQDGQYVIALPSVRCYIDQTVVDPDDPDSHDECWVIALDTEDAGDPQIITAQWRQKVYRSGLCPAGREDWEGAADGTLHTDDVAAGNTILDKTETYITDEFPDETWEEIRIWCYNRVHNYQTGHSVDLVLFTTQGAEETEASGLIADFEDDGTAGFNPQYLDHNIDAYGLAFVRSNSILGIGFGWIADTGEVYEGTNCALAELNAGTQNTSQLELTINVLDPGQYVEFYYWYDNRRGGTRFDPDGPHELTNFPEVDHQFKILVNGETVDIEVITDPDGVPDSETGNSIIDNETLPSGNPYNQESFYEQWRKVRIPVNAGTNTIRWIVNRKWVDEYGHLILRIDKIILPPIMTGQDINAVHRWFYDGTRVRANPFWAWARRDEEDDTYIAARVTTVPDFITMLVDGRIAIGNPHYVAVIKYNEEDDEWALDEDFGFPGGDGFPPHGFIRFTASPNSAVSEDDCEDPDPDFVDQISDPPVGVFQILPTSDAGFQIRCANATMRDATNYPIDTDVFTFIDPRTGEERQEKFRELLKVRTGGIGGWASRCHAWTISSDGKTRVPHVEVVWRPTRYQTAWPEEGPYNCPPYRLDFEDALPNNPDWAGNLFEGGILHLRDPLDIQTDEERADSICWTLMNYIIPRSYCDTLSRTPQAAWIRVTDDPEDPEGEGDYWEPCDGNTPPHTVPPDPAVYPIDTPRNTNSPWGSARWKLIQHRLIPITRNCRIFYNEPINPDSDTLCGVENPEIEGYTARVTIRTDDVTGTKDFYSFPDFDAVFEVDPGCEGYPAYGGCQSC